MRRAAALAALLLTAGCSSPLERVFSFSGDAPSRTGLVPLGDGAVFGNDAGRVVLLGPDGVARWTAELAHEVRIRPVVVGETVVVATAAGDVVGLDAKSGFQRWRTEIPGGAAALAGAGTRAHLLSEQGELHGLEAGTGLVVWHVQCAPALGLKPGAAARAGLEVAPGGQLLVSGPSAVMAISADDGTRRWRAAVREPTGLLVEEGLVWTVDQGGHALALALETGEIRRQRSLGAAPVSPPARALDRLWVGLGNRTLVGFRPGDEAPPWTVEVPAPVVAAVAEFEGRLLVPTSGREGRLLAIDIGAPGNAPSARVDSPLRTSPLVRADLAWQLAQDGRVLAFRLRSVAGSAR